MTKLILQVKTKDGGFYRILEKNTLGNEVFFLRCQDSEFEIEWSDDLIIDDSVYFFYPYINGKISTVKTFLKYLSVRLKKV